MHSLSGFLCVNHSAFAQERSTSFANLLLFASFAISSKCSCTKMIFFSSFAAPCAITSSLFFSARTKISTLYPPSILPKILMARTASSPSILRPSITSPRNSAFIFAASSTPGFTRFVSKFIRNFSSFCAFSSPLELPASLISSQISLVCLAFSASGGTPSFSRSLTCFS